MDARKAPRSSEWPSIEDDARMSTNGDVRMGGPVKRVMVGTDRSVTAERAVAWAAAFADRY